MYDSLPIVTDHSGDKSEDRFENTYICSGDYPNGKRHAETVWTDRADSMCNDRCPVCNAETEPSSSVDL